MASIDRLSALVTFVFGCLFTALLAAPAGAQVVGVVTVTVSSGDAGMPLAGATVDAIGESRSVTDSRGQAQLRGLTPGHHTLLVAAFGHADQSLDVQVENGRVTRLEVVLEVVPFELAPITVDGDARAPGEAIVRRVEDAPAGVTGVADLLADVPGITVVRRGASGSETTVQLRGASADQLLVLLDGVPLNGSGSGAADLSLVDLETLERVVVLPGARSARYGPRALAGVVLLESRRPAGHSAEATAGVGAWGAMDLGVAASAAVTERISAMVGGSWSSSTGAFRYTVPDFRGGGVATRDNARSERVGGHVALRHDGPAARLTLRLDGTATDRGSPGAIAQPSLTGEQSHDRVGAALSSDFGQTRRGASARLAFQSRRSEYRDPSPPLGQAYDDYSDVDEVEGAAEAWWNAEAISVRGGVQSRRVHVDATPLGASGVMYHEAGAWAEASAEFLLAGAGTVLLSAGLRADRHDLVDGVVLSPTASLEWRTASVEAGLRYADGFAPPSVSDLFFQEGVLVRANPELRPERVRGEWSAHVGAAWRVGRVTLRPDLSAWTADVEDMILWFPDFRFVWSPDNFFVTRRGAEASLAADVATGALLHSLTGRLGTSEVEYADGGLDGQVAYRPRSTASLSVRTERGGAALDVRYSRIGVRRSVAGSALNALPAYAEIDTGIAVPFTIGGRDARLELSVSNLLDRPAALLADYPLPGRGWAVRLRLS